MDTMLMLVIAGAICMLIITGGAMTMADTEPTTTHLASGAAIGAGLGAAAASVYSGVDVTQMTKLFETSSMPDMKVGLPAF
jgi:hypothetical protein